MNSKKFYLETVGCQMNVLDSELIAAELMLRGFRQTSNRKEADVVLFNTCSVRSHAEEKIYSALGRLKHWKEIKPNGVLGVLGCMAQKDQKLIFRRAPHVDLVLGPGQLDKLPELLSAIETDRAPRIAVSVDRFRERRQTTEVKESFRQFDPRRIPEARPSKFQAMVRIMFGCNKFCSYCIVPGVRGPEQSRPAADIVAEIRKLADQGCVDLTLIGQTVNSYQYQEGEKTVFLPDLLERIDAIDGVRRVRFVSNYPVGMTDELLQAVRDLPSAVPFLHVPAQHGADSVLKRMKRMYSVAEYKELVDRIYATIPDVSLTSDFIVGFCGETEDEFLQTADLIRYAKFKNSFIFKYSVREGTFASRKFLDDVSEEAKKRRNNELLAVQNEISASLNARFVGKTVEILVEGPSKNQVKSQNRETDDDFDDSFNRSETPFGDDFFEPDSDSNLSRNPNSNSNPNPNAIESANDELSTTRSKTADSISSIGLDANGRLPLISAASQEPTLQLAGRTPCDRIVVFNGSPATIGTFQRLKIVEAAPFTLFGERQD